MATTALVKCVPRCESYYAFTNVMTSLDVENYICFWNLGSRTIVIYVSWVWIPKCLSPLFQGSHFIFTTLKQVFQHSTDINELALCATSETSALFHLFQHECLDDWRSSRSGYILYRVIQWWQVVLTVLHLNMCTDGEARGFVKPTVLLICFGLAFIHI